MIYWTLKTTLKADEHSGYEEVERGQLETDELTAALYMFSLMAPASDLTNEHITLEMTSRKPADWPEEEEDDVSE